MKNIFSVVCGAVLCGIIFLTAQAVQAESLTECLMETLKSADDSVTAGEIRAQCQEKAAAVSGNVAAAGTVAAGSSGGPEQMVLKTVEGRKPAYFPHRKHQDMYTCNRCHHGRTVSGNMEEYTPESGIQKCTVCHNGSMPNGELNGYQMIGHRLCRDCHRKLKDITSAKCSTCHRKNL